jgi:hypothetical protein
MRRSCAERHRSPSQHDEHDAWVRADVMNAPGARLTFAISSPTSDDDFQALLARLDQRLEALIEVTESEAQTQQHRPGMSY